jgi:hypothetical protein
MVDRIAPGKQASLGGIAQAQMTVDTGSSQAKIAGIFSDLAVRANDSADLSAEASAEEQAARDLRNNPDGIPPLRGGQSIRAQAYNTTTKNLYSIRADTQMQGHLNQLAVTHKADPASYAKLSKEYIDSFVSQADQVDPSIAIQMKAKFELLTSNKIPELQINADEKLLGDIRQGHADAEVTLAQTIESNVSRLYDPSDDGMALNSISVLMSDYERQLRTSLNPHDGSPIYDSDTVDNIMHEKWGYITQEGLLTRIPKLNNKELMDWQEKIGDDTFQAKFYTPQTGGVDVPLNMLLDSKDRRSLLNQVEQEIRQRASLTDKQSFAQQVQIQNMIQDHIAQAANKGTVDGRFSMEQAEALGLSAKEFVAYNNSVDEGVSQFVMNESVALASPHEELAGGNILRNAASQEGDQAHEVRRDRETFDKAVDEKRLALHGDGNSLEYVIKYDKNVRGEMVKFLNGEIEFEQYAQTVDNYYERNNVPATKRDYLLQQDVDAWNRKFPQVKGFDLDPALDEPHYSAALLGTVNAIQNTYGARTASVVAQLDKQGDIPNKTLGIFRIPQENLNARLSFAHAIGEEKEINNLVPKVTQDEVELSIEEDITEFIQSVTPGQDGKFTMFRQYKEAMALQAKYYMTNDGTPQKESIERAVKDFIGDFTLVDTSHGGIASFVRISPENDVEKKKMTEGIKSLTKATKEISTSSLNLYPPLSGFQNKENQSNTDMQEAFEYGVATQGVWRTTSDGTHVKLYYQGAPVHTIGTNRGVREVVVPIHMLSTLSNPKATDSIYELAEFGGSADTPPFSDVVNQDAMLDYINQREPVMYIDVNGNPITKPDTLPNSMTPQMMVP